MEKARQYTDGVPEVALSIDNGVSGSSASGSSASGSGASSVDPTKRQHISSLIQKFARANRKIAGYADGWPIFAKCE